MEDDAPEDRAIAELGRRVRRWRLTFVSAAVIVGVLGGIAGYWVFRARQLEARGAHSPLLTGAVALGAGFMVVIGGALLGRLFIALRLKSWIHELAARHGVPESELADVTDSLE